MSDSTSVTHSVDARSVGESDGGSPGKKNSKSGGKAKKSKNANNSSLSPSSLSGSGTPPSVASISSDSPTTHTSMSSSPKDDDSTDHEEDQKEFKTKKDGGSADISAIWGKWGQADAKALFVRGPNYMHDAKKVHVEDTMFELVLCEVLATHTKLDHEAARPGSYVNSETRKNDKDKPLLFIVNFQVPGSPNVHVITYFKRKPPKSPTDHSDAGFETLLDRFLNGTDEFRDRRLKFIPHVIEGNWLVRKGVGTKPAVIGKRLKQRYYQSKELNYFEADVDVGSSSVGGSIFKLVRGFAVTLTMDLCFTLEGQLQDELPERLVGGVRMAHCDVSKLETIDHTTHEFHK